MQDPINCEDLIPPIDPTNFPLSPPAELESGAPYLDGACEVAVSLVLRSALPMTEIVFSAERWPTREQDLLDSGHAIGSRVRQGWDDQFEDVQDLDYRDLVEAAVLAIRPLMILDISQQLTNWLKRPL